MQRNLAVPEKHHLRKKVRGSKRKLQALGRKLDSVLLSIPEEGLPRDKTWRYHLPSPDRLVDSAASSFKLRKRFVHLLCDKLIELDRSINREYKTVLFFSLPLLSHSRIEVYVDSKHFENLISNPDGASTWSPKTDGKSIIREFSLELPPEYQEKGYYRTSADSPRQENWIIWRSI